MNTLIIDNLTVLAKQTNDRWRKKAYTDAIASIKKHPVPITSGAEAGKLPGVGSSISKKIDEILATGHLKGVQSSGLDRMAIIRQLESVTGIGQVHAEKLYAQGARSIDDLRDPKYFNTLTAWQQAGVKYHEALLKRVPKSIIAEMECIIQELLEQVCEEHDIDCLYEVCGSYRRGAETCGDMDVLISTRFSEPLMDYLVKSMNKYILATLGHGTIKYMGIVSLHGTVFRLDIERIDLAKWPYALLYFTGSAEFNKRQRMTALAKGYTLSEHGLRNLDTNEWVQGLMTERDVFKFLGMKYQKPCERK